jgi:excisionase family DNA binding protein
MQTLNQIVTKPELAARYAVTERTITNWMQARRISFLKIGRIVRFDLDLVEKELRQAGLIKAK